MCDVLICFCMYYIRVYTFLIRFINVVFVIYYALLFSWKLETEEAWEETSIKHLPPSKLHMPPTEKWSGGLTLGLFLKCGI